MPRATPQLKRLVTQAGTPPPYDKVYEVATAVRSLIICMSGGDTAQKLSTLLSAETHAAGAQRRLMADCVTPNKSLAILRSRKTCLAAVGW